jgi:hypothetical protein
MREVPFLVLVQHVVIGKTLKNIAVLLIIAAVYF